LSPLLPVPLTIEHALLGLLREGPAHGYGIHRRLGEAGGLALVWRLKQAHLYALLRRLEAEGYVQSRREEQRSRPTRKVYRLTPAGRRAFLRWVDSPVERGRDFRLNFLAKFYFAGREGPQSVALLLERQRFALREWLASQRAKADQAGESAGYEWLVYRFRTGQIEAMMAWLDRCEASLVESPKESKRPRPGRAGR
jgi:DNA-binding PadR family transcriptional regulator